MKAGGVTKDNGWESHFQEGGRKERNLCLSPCRIRNCRNACLPCVITEERSSWQVPSIIHRPLACKGWGSSGKHALTCLGWSHPPAWKAALCDYQTELISSCQAKERRQAWFWKFAGSSVCVWHARKCMRRHTFTYQHIFNERRRCWHKGFTDISDELIFTNLKALGHEPAQELNVLKLAF